MEPISGRVVRKINVLVANNSRIHTQLLSDALQRDPSLAVIRWDGDAATLLPTILTHNIDVLAITSCLNGHADRGLELVRELHAVSASTKCVILLDSQKDQRVIEAFRAGAKGIFSSESSVEMFCKCIQRVYQGEIWVDNRGVALAIDALASAPVVRTIGARGLNQLSKREFEVVQCVVQGMTNGEIAHRMGLSRHTIKNYLFRIFDKLGVSSRVELLFMTLNQRNSLDEPAPKDVLKKAPEFEHFDEPTLDFLEKAAEKGVVTAQLALAQAYLARRAGPDDLVNAYTWYLIAAERMSHARLHVTKALSVNQIDEAQQKASFLLARMKQTPASIPGPAMAKPAWLRPAI